LVIRLVIHPRRQVRARTILYALQDSNIRGIEPDNPFSDEHTPKFPVIHKGTQGLLVTAEDLRDFWGRKQRL